MAAVVADAQELRRAIAAVWELGIDVSAERSDHVHKTEARPAIKSAVP